MANFKRKRSKRQVRCTMCTQHRWKGNSRKKREGRFDPQTKRRTQKGKEED